MSHHETHSAEVAVDTSGDSCVDAKSIVALIAIIVVAVCFWLIGQ